MKKKVRLHTMIAFLMALVTLVACRGTPPRDGGECLALDEFTPLLASWKTLDIPATGNDITSNLQAAVDALSTNTLAGTLGTSRTIYIPPGSWTISATVNVRYAFGFNIVGADPSTTTIKWAPLSSLPYPDMFRIWDVSSMKFSRLTLDGGNLARIGIHLFQSGCYDAVLHASYDSTEAALCGLAITDTGRITAVTRIEFSDDVFKNLEFGLAAGALAYNDLAGDPRNIGNKADFRTGVPQGISTSNVGDIVVRRCRFRDISALGVNIQGSNAFNWLIADSDFEHCFRGIQVTQHGGAHVINNHFASNGLSSSQCYWDLVHPLTDGMDIFFNGDEASVIRGNSSEGSRKFLAVGAFGQLGSVDVSGNFITTTYVASAPAEASIVSSNAQLTFFDNFIQATGFPSGTEPIAFLQYAYGTWGNLVGNPRITDGRNTFVTNDPNCTVTCGDASASPNPGCSFIKKSGNVNAGAGNTVQRITVDANSCVAAATIIPSACPSLVPASRSAACAAHDSAVIPVAPPSSGRPVTYVTASKPTDGAASSAIASACIHNSGLSCGEAISTWLTAQKAMATTPFLFFPAGAYYLDKPVEIPGDFDVVIGGDGSATQFLWAGTSVGGESPYVFHLNSPSKASIRDLAVYVNDPSATHAGGILVDSPDDVGGLVYLDTVGVGWAKSGFDLLGLDNVAIRADMSGAAYGERVFAVAGGGKAAPSLGGSSNTKGLLMVAGGSGAAASYADLRNWGKAVLIGTDNEANPQGIDLWQSGYLTLATGRFLSQQQLAGMQTYFADQPNAVVRSTFRGRFTMMGVTGLRSSLVGSAATPEAQILSLNNFYEAGGLSPLQPHIPVCPATVASTLDCSFFAKLSATAVQTSQMELQDASRCTVNTTADPDVSYPNVFYCSNLPASWAATPAATSSFVTTMLTDERAARMGPPSACSSTAVRVHRVSFQGNPSPFIPSNFMGSGVRVQRF